MDERVHPKHPCNFSCSWCVHNFVLPYALLADQAPIGWTIFDNLFVLNGTPYVVTDYPASVPDIIYMTSNGLAIYSGPEAAKSRLPSDRDLRVISTTQAQSLFGSSAESIDGITVSHKGNLDFYWSAYSFSDDTTVAC
jgi:hypothetical protein